MKFFRESVNSDFAGESISFKNDYAPNKIMQSKYSAHQGFLEGFMIAILNPKIAAWLLALFSQFVQPEALLAEQFVLVSTVGVIDTSWYCLVAFLASSEKLVKVLQHNYSRIELGMGLLLIILAAGMVIALLGYILETCMIRFYFPFKNENRRDRKVIRNGDQKNLQENNQTQVKFEEVNQTLLLQQLIVAAMKCKQNVEQSKCDAASDLVTEFSVSYFDEHGMEHLKEIKNKK